MQYILKSFGVAVERDASEEAYKKHITSELVFDKDGNETTVKGKGRHDPCVLPRAVPIVESMAALVLIDFVLRNRACKL